MKWIVIGGAGYIGSHTVRRLLQCSKEVLVLDDLSSGMKSRLPNDCPFEVVDSRNYSTVKDIFERFRPDGVMNFAAKKHARESNQIPWDYWSVNIGSLLGFLSAIKGSSVKHIVHSSSCSIFGSSNSVTEYSPVSPESTYGWTKVVSEKILESLVKQLSLGVTSLRYFNVIGCANFKTAFDSSTECLVPATFNRIRLGQALKVYGNDFDTPDGTALRDYIDVRDLAEAHLKAVMDPPALGEFRAVNVSTGIPISVRQIVDEVLELIASPDYPIEVTPRMPGDPSAIWSEPSSILKKWGWDPKYSIRDSLFAHHKATSMDEDQSH
jgi:UDP-glucose 4-epimerase